MSSSNSPSSPRLSGVAYRFLRWPLAATASVLDAPPPPPLSGSFFRQFLLKPFACFDLVARTALWRRSINVNFAQYIAFCRQTLWMDGWMDGLEERRRVESFAIIGSGKFLKPRLDRELICIAAGRLDYQRRAGALGNQGLPIV